MPLNIVFSRPQNWSRLKPYYSSTITTSKDMKIQVKIPSKILGNSEIQVKFKHQPAPKYHTNGVHTDLLTAWEREHWFLQQSGHFVAVVFHPSIARTQYHFEMSGLRCSGLRLPHRSTMHEKKASCFELWTASFWIESVGKYLLKLS